MIWAEEYASQAAQGGWMIANAGTERAEIRRLPSDRSFKSEFHLWAVLIAAVELGDVTATAAVLHISEHNLEGFRMMIRVAGEQLTCESEPSAPAVQPAVDAEEAA